MDPLDLVRKEGRKGETEGGRGVLGIRESSSHRDGGETGTEIDNSRKHVNGTKKSWRAVTSQRIKYQGSSEINNPVEYEKDGPVPHW